MKWNHWKFFVKICKVLNYYTIRNQTHYQGSVISEEIASLIPNPRGYDPKKREFKLGQWVDVKDTMDQWLEAEIIDIRTDMVRIHYNGWGRRWDEWIPKNR